MQLCGLVRHSFCGMAMAVGAAYGLVWVRSYLTSGSGRGGRGIPTVPYAQRANSSQLSVWAVLSSDSHNVIFPLTFCFSNYAWVPPSPCVMCCLQSVFYLLLNFAHSLWNSSGGT